MKHKHHVIPRHMGGSDDPSNLIELTPLEHAEAHRLLYEQHGHWQDYVAWQGLAKLTENFDAAKESMIYGGRKGNKVSNNQWKDPVLKAQRVAKFKRSMEGKWNRNCLGRKGAENYAAQTYKITLPCGTIEIVKGLKLWCENNGLSYNTFYNMCIGRGRSHKGYTAVKIS